MEEIGIRCAWLDTGGVRGLVFSVPSILALARAGVCAQLFGRRPGAVPARVSRMMCQSSAWRPASCWQTERLRLSACARRSVDPASALRSSRIISAAQSRVCLHAQPHDLRPLRTALRNVRGGPPRDYPPLTAYGEHRTASVLLGQTWITRLGYREVICLGVGSANIGQVRDADSAQVRR